MGTYRNDNRNEWRTGGDEGGDRDNNGGRQMDSWRQGRGDMDDERQRFAGRGDDERGRFGYGGASGRGQQDDDRMRDDRPRYSGQGGQSGSNAGFGQQDRGGYGMQQGGGYGQFDRGGYGQQDRGDYRQQDRGSYGHQDRGGYGQQDRGGYGMQDRGQFDRGGYGQQDRGRGYESYGSEGGQVPGRPNTGYGGRGYGMMAGEGSMDREQTGYQERGRSQGQSMSGGHRGKAPAGYQRSDDRIREEVCQALSDDDHVDASGIEVTVKSGEVTLAGKVSDRRTKRMAEDLVERVTGVKDVTNQIRVDSDQQGSQQHTGNGGARQPGQSMTNTTDKDADQSKRPRA